VLNDTFSEVFVGESLRICYSEWSVTRTCFISRFSTLL